MQREREEVLGGALARRTETVAPHPRRRAARRPDREPPARLRALPPPHGDRPLGRGARLHRRARWNPPRRPRPSGRAAPPAHPARGNRRRCGSGSAPTRPSARDLHAALARLRRRASVPPSVRPSAGSRGFRRSHEAALSVHRLLAGNPDAERLATYGELEVTALAAQDERRASGVRHRDARAAGTRKPLRHAPARDAADLPRGGRARAARRRPPAHPPQHRPTARRPRHRAARLPPRRAPPCARARARAQTTPPTTANRSAGGRLITLPTV